MTELWRHEDKNETKFPKLQSVLNHMSLILLLRFSYEMFPTCSSVYDVPPYPRPKIGVQFSNSPSTTLGSVQSMRTRN